MVRIDFRPKAAARLPIAVCLAAFVAFDASAEPARSAVLPQVVSSAELQFTPSGGHFLVSCDGSESIRIPGILARASHESQDGEPKTGTEVWTLGAPVEQQCSMLRWTGVFETGDGDHWFTPVEEMTLADRDFSLEDPALLQTRMAEARKAVRAGEKRLRELQGEEGRLKADAELILNIGKMVDASAGAHAAEGASETPRVTAAELFEASFAEMSSEPRGPADLVRERELVAALRDAAVRTHEAELTERSRRSRGESEIGRRMALIEETRFEDEEALKAELESIRIRRKRLELEAGIRDREQ